MCRISFSLRIAMMKILQPSLIKLIIGLQKKYIMLNLQQQILQDLTQEIVQRPILQTMHSHLQEKLKIPPLKRRYIQITTNQEKLSFLLKQGTKFTIQKLRHQQLQLHLNLVLGMHFKLLKQVDLLVRSKVKISFKLKHLIQVMCITRQKHRTSLKRKQWILREHPHRHQGWHLRKSES